ncbi:MAG TPA: YtxH domain-containing protein [Dehalococcoidia bacterium]|nr:YtxH domain-containing protein [Dehalococcoidia bacterium]
MKLLMLGMMMMLGIGVVIGLLLAPRPGTEMRSQLKERAEPIIRFKDRRREEAA